MNAKVDAFALEGAKALLKDGQTIEFTAHGGSMRPFIQSGDRLTIRADVSALTVGDVVWVRCVDKDVVHRVIAIDERGRLMTRGDALPRDDGWFETSAYLGTVHTVEREGVVRVAPDTKAHRCLVAFFRALRHIVWRLG